MYVLAQHKGWELERLYAYTADEPPTYVLNQINSPHACAFTSLARVVKFLTSEESQ